MMGGLKDIKTLVIGILVLLGVNVFSSFWYERFDLTQDKRYTLSEAAIETITTVDSPLYIDVFLSGDLPSEFSVLSTPKPIVMSKQPFNSKWSILD